MKPNIKTAEWTAANAPGALYQQLEDLAQSIAPADKTEPTLITNLAAQICGLDEEQNFKPLARRFLFAILAADV